MGKTITSLTGLSENSDEVDIRTSTGELYRFYHDQDCCECVSLNDWEALPDDFAGAVVLSAEEVSGDESPPEGYDEQYGESYSWTFYKIDTDKGDLWMRWLGESNGYYSEHVSFIHVNKPSEED